MKEKHTRKQAGKHENNKREQYSNIAENQAKIADGGKILTIRNF